MSLKLRVQVSVGATSRQVEVDRAKPDYNSLRNEVQKKTKQQGVYGQIRVSDWRKLLWQKYKIFLGGLSTSRSMTQ